jgi:deoxyribodipyrimidine photo-lyase
MSSQKPYGIHWFRRDLRVHGNAALQWNWKKHEGRVLGVFCFDSKFLGRADFSANRFGFFIQTMKALRDELRASGGDLLVLDEGYQQGFELLMQTLKSKGLPLPGAVSWNRDYEPYARKRDGFMSEWLPRNWGVAVHTERDHLVIEPWELLRDGKEAGTPGAFYQVYSPFAKKWFELFHSEEVQSRIKEQKKALAQIKKEPVKDIFQLTWSDLFSGKNPLKDHLEHFEKENAKQVTIPLPEAVGTRAALEEVIAFRSKIDEYGEKRDFPFIRATSRLSMYFKNGSLTPGLVIAALDLHDTQLSRKESGRTKWLKEVVWREFYYSILWNCPRAETEAFLEHYKELAWENDKKLFQAWVDGETGYPIVDAGMRELKATGFMHNRVRMIVASFLTKDLLIDWRWGEKYFMEQLLDGDLAPNNGGWQWAASTGCDPQPYFRIFNPRLQGEKFDPEGEYVCRWIPELKKVPTKYIHAPQDSGMSLRYPKPIVNHAEQKEKALALYKR